MRVDPELGAEFPGLRAVELEAEELRVTKSNVALESMKTRVYQEVRTSGLSLETVKDHPLLKAYRNFYWKVGIDPTKTRPAAEALLRRVLGGREIPAINTLVDAYNLVSLKTAVAIAAFDSKEVHSELFLLRRARPGERFLGIGMADPIALEGREAVIEDTADHALVAVYPFRNAEHGKVTEGTRNAFLIMCGVPGIGDPPLVRAKELCEQFLSEFCREGGR